jgi:hypothetical protein
VSFRLSYEVSAGECNGPDHGSAVPKEDPDTMSTSPPPGAGDPAKPSFAEENAMKIASESISHYDEASDTYHCSYGPPVPAVTVHDPDRGLLVRVEPTSRQVVGFSIPQFKEWHAAHAEPDGGFEVDLPSMWALSPDDDIPQAPPEG